jgi:2-polyprenyl-6-methoxyphenol hydroxylase-like FAD-dependent oxidoreductase
MNIVVAGAGMAGLSAALCLGRAGHRVTLLERDALGLSESLKQPSIGRERALLTFSSRTSFCLEDGAS